MTTKKIRSLKVSGVDRKSNIEEMKIRCINHQINKIKTNDIKPKKILPALDTAFASNSETNGVVLEPCNFEGDVAEAM